MKVKDEILNEWSFRCHDGIVDLNDPKKLRILKEILEEFNIKEIDIIIEGDEKYNQVIKIALDKANLLLPNGDIPPVKEKYVLGDNNTNVNGDDAKIFKALYPIAPPKKDQDVESAGSKGAGNGEIALYWLFAYQNPAVPATGNPGRGKADLIIKDEYVEVKAFDSKSMTFGRIGSDKENIELLNTLFGLHSLLSSIDPTVGKDKQASSLRFSKKDIIQAFKTFNIINNNEELKKLSKDYPLIALIYKKVNDLITKIKDKLPNTNIDDAEDAAGALIKLILLKKVNEKMDSEKGGYIVNISPDGDLKYLKIDKISIDKIPNKDVLESVYINQGALVITPEELFK
jgi:hypothetical protein